MISISFQINAYLLTDGLPLRKDSQLPLLSLQPLRAIFFFILQQEDLSDRTAKCMLISLGAMARAKKTRMPARSNRYRVISMISIFFHVNVCNSVEFS